MPMMRSPASASPSIARYRGSRMCSGRNTFGNSTTFGSGKSGIVVGSIERGRVSVDRFRLAIHVVHQDVLAERVRRGEVRLAATDGRHPAHERDQVRIARQHERI